MQTIRWVWMSHQQPTAASRRLPIPVTLTVAPAPMYPSPLGLSRFAFPALSKTSAHRALMMSVVVFSKPVLIQSSALTLASFGAQVSTPTCAACPARPLFAAAVGPLGLGPRHSPRSHSGVDDAGDFARFVVFGVFQVAGIPRYLGMRQVDRRLDPVQRDELAGARQLFGACDADAEGPGGAGHKQRQRSGCTPLQAAIIAPRSAFGKLRWMVGRVRRRQRGFELLTRDQHHFRGTGIGLLGSRDSATRCLIAVFSVWITTVNRMMLISVARRIRAGSNSGRGVRPTCPCGKECDSACCVAQARHQRSAPGLGTTGEQPEAPGMTAHPAPSVFRLHQTLYRQPSLAGLARWTIRPPARDGRRRWRAHRTSPPPPCCGETTG